MRISIQTTFLRTMMMVLRAVAGARWRSSRTRCEKVWVSSLTRMIIRMRSSKTPRSSPTKSNLRRRHLLVVKEGSKT